MSLFRNMVCGDVSLTLHDNDTVNNGWMKVMRNGVWAKSSSYYDLVYALKYDYMSHKALATISILDDDVLGEYFTEIFEADHLIEYDLYAACITSYGTARIKGWSAGVQSLFSEIKKQI